MSCSKTIGMLCRSMLGVLSSGWYMKGVDDLQQTLRYPILDEDNRARVPPNQGVVWTGFATCVFVDLTEVTISTITFHLRKFVR